MYKCEFCSAVNEDCSNMPPRFGGCTLSGVFESWIASLELVNISEVTRNVGSGEWRSTSKAAASLGLRTCTTCGKRRSAYRGGDNASQSEEGETLINP
jgi:hypothetical protein